MKVYIVMCDEPDDFMGTFTTTVEKVFLDEAKAKEYAKNENKHYTSFFYVEEMEVE